MVSSPTNPTPPSAAAVASRPLAVYEASARLCTSDIADEITFATVNGGLVQAVVQALIAVILEDGVIDRLDHASRLGRIGQLGIVVAEFGPEKHASIALEQLLVGDFLPAGLDGKVGLAEGDDLLLGVGILDGQVAGIAGHQDGFDRSQRALA